MARKQVIPKGLLDIPFVNTQILSNIIVERIGASSEIIVPIYLHTNVPIN